MILRRPPRVLIASTASAMTLLAIGGCSGSAGGKPAMPPPTVSVAPATRHDVQEFDEFTARLEAPETVDIRARVAGALDKIHFREGQIVRKGDPLFTIDPRPFAAEVARAQAQLTAARTQAELSKSELARVEKLIAIQGVSQQEVDQMRAAERNAESTVRVAEASLTQARLNLEFTRITAPVAGRTSRANVTVGNLVSVGEPVLTTLVSSDKVYAYFEASEATYLKYVHAVRAGTLPSARTNPNPVVMGLVNEEGYPHKGQMDFVDNRLNPVTGSIRGRAVFSNEDGLFTPGLFARVKLIGRGSYAATLVADRAITTDQTRRMVFVVGNDKVVQARLVKPGALIDGMRVVEGVEPGELVVVDGLLRAVPGAPVNPQVLKTDERGMPIPAAPASGPGTAKQ
jgi:RND family efflux transporter MFP subunit